MVKIVNERKKKSISETIIVCTDSSGEITSSNLFFNSIFSALVYTNINQILMIDNGFKPGKHQFNLIEYPTINLQVFIIENDSNQNLFEWKIELNQTFEEIKSVEQKIEYHLLNASKTVLIEQGSLKTISKIEFYLNNICKYLKASFLVIAYKESLTGKTQYIFSLNANQKLIDEVSTAKKHSKYKAITILSEFEISEELSKNSISKVATLHNENKGKIIDLFIAYKEDNSYLLQSSRTIKILNSTLSSLLIYHQQIEFADFMRFGYNNAPNPVIWIDANGEAIYCNKASKHLTGYDKAQFIGENLFEIYPKIKNEICTDLNKDQEIQFTLETTVKDNSIFSLKIKRLLFENNSYYCIYGVNINQQILSEKKLGQQKQYLVQLHNIHTSNYDSIENLLIDYLKSGCEAYKCNIALINQLKDDTFNVVSDFGDSSILDKKFIDSFSDKILKKEKTQLVYLPFDKGKISFIIGSPIYLEDKIKGVVILCSTKDLNHQNEKFDTEYIDLISLNIANILVASKIDSERKNAEEELKRSKLRYKSIIEDQSELICRYDKNGNILFANNAYCELMNRNPSNIIGSSVFINGNNDELKSNFFKRLSTLTYENPLTADKEEVYFGNKQNGRWIAWNDRAIFDDDKNLIEYQSVGTDITEQKSRIDFLQKIIDTIPNTIMVKDFDGNILMCNKTAAEKYNLSVEELVGQNDYDLCKDAVKRHIFKETDIETIKNNSLTIFPDQEFTDIATNKNRYIQTYKIPITALNGKKDNILVVAIDITDRKLVSMALENSNNDLKLLAEKLKKSNDELKNFAYVASHDLQEPLRMIASYIQLLNKKYGNQLDETAHEFIHFAVDGAKRMQNLITDLLEYSRIQTRLKPFKQFDLNNLLEEVEQNLKKKIEENNATIVSDDLPKIIGDRSQISRLIQNLIDNAIKFKRKEHPKIYVTVKDHTDYYKFGIADNGIGISDEYKNSVFEIFNRLHSSAEYNGTGIGLSICKKVVQRHGGKIWIEKSDFGGCNFIFTIKKLAENANLDSI